MEKSSTSRILPSLEEVREQFEAWRRTRKNRCDPIPPRLWNVAVKLAGRYSIYSISKALRLRDVQTVKVPHPPYIFCDLNCRERLGYSR